MPPSTKKQTGIAPLFYSRPQAARRLSLGLGAFEVIEDTLPGRAVIGRRVMFLRSALDGYIEALATRADEGQAGSDESRQ